MRNRFKARLRRTWLRARGPAEARVFYDPAFRLPIVSLGTRHGLETRRADFVAWYLVAEGWLHTHALLSPAEVTYADLARVHTPRLLESLTSGEALASVFTADAHEIQVDQVMGSIRKAVGATVEAARLALQQQGPVLNLLGGFHHASPNKAAGLCPVNDIAVAIAALRQEGFSGLVVVLDLDAHPPDGTADCLQNDPDTWIGSISGSDWGPMDGVDETVLPEGSDDATYMAALTALIERTPRGDLAFVLAGGDVIAGDKAGMLGLTIGGARERDLLVLNSLRGVPSVWLPAGGYSTDAWRVLAGTALAILHRSRAEVPASIEPMSKRFRRIARDLEPDRLGGTESELDAEELEIELGLRRPTDRRLLGTYTTEGLLYALQRFGVLPYLRRIGYDNFHAEIVSEALGQRLRIMGDDAQGATHLLAESLIERRKLADRPVVFVHWLTLRNPLAEFGHRARLPGQEVPGLGLSMEVIGMLEQTARRIGADGVAFRPSWFHTAWSPSDRVRFVQDARQGRYEALLRDLGQVPRHELSRLLQEQGVLLNGEPYAWEPSDMVLWIDGKPPDTPQVMHELRRCHFSLTKER